MSQSEISNDRGSRIAAEEILEVIEELQQGQITQRFLLSLNNAIVFLRYVRDYFAYRRGMMEYRNIAGNCIHAYYVFMPALKEAKIFVGDEERWIKDFLAMLEDIRDRRALPEDEERLDGLVKAFRAVKRG